MVLEKFSLEGKVVVVTGAAGNLGGHMARALAKAGADVAVTDIRPEPLEHTAADVRQLDRKSIALVADICDSRQVDRMINGAIAEFGKVDILINNAGTTQGSVRRPIEEVTDNEWHRSIDINLSGAFYCCRAITKHMLERRKGKVINVASGFGLVGRRNHYAYCCAKAGVISLTKVLALSWARAGINVNCIAPGFFGGPFDQRTPEEIEYQKSRSRLIPVGYSGPFEQMEHLAVFLASDASDYITGEVFSIDGGALADGYAPSGYAPIIPLHT